MAKNDEYYTYQRADKRFFAPLEESIAAADTIPKIAAALPGADIVRHGIWALVRFKGEPEAEGWKIHVSCTPENFDQTIDVVSKCASEYRVDFKTFIDSSLLELALSRAWPATQIGKIFTMYPGSSDSLRDQVTSRLASELQGKPGPGILAEVRPDPAAQVYIRYGAYQTTSLTDSGYKQGLITQNGEVRTDSRKLSDKTEPASSISVGEFYLNEVIHFGSTGGVLGATRKDSTENLVFKYHRTHTGYSPDGRDAAQRLEDEFKLLSSLGTDPRWPMAVDCGSFSESKYIVLTRMSGHALFEFVARNSPIIQNSLTPDSIAKYKRLIDRFEQNLRTLLADLRKLGCTYVDFSPTNIFVTDDGDVSLVDFEGAVPDADDRITRPIAFTEGFSIGGTDAVGMPVEDLHSFGIGSALAYAAYPRNPLRAVAPDAFARSVEFGCKLLGWDAGRILEMIGLSPTDHEIRLDPTTLEDSARFVEESSPGQLRLEPSGYETNAAGFLYGASGALSVWSRVGRKVPAEWWDTIDRQDLSKLSYGFGSGVAGICLALEIGAAEDEIKKRFDNHLRNFSVEYMNAVDATDGLASVGLSMLELQALGHDYNRHLQQIANALVNSASDDGRGYLWDACEGNLGLGYGSAGIALFLLRFGDRTGSPEFMQFARRALEHDISYSREAMGVVGYPGHVNAVTMSPYLAGGSAGMAIVMNEFQVRAPELSESLVSRTDDIVASLHGGMSVSPGYWRGSAGIIDAMRIVRGESAVANNTISSMAAALSVQPEGLAVPGFNLMRFSHDFATGSAGVIGTIFGLASGIGAHPLFTGCSS
ncbi:lanthionine synthetase LanC family protein [Microlunatus sp. GCM10028923]|uniref:class III lanthionine synthetase LanKC N-terminal domain-containing protein n=1 Tax=Microlunatus sp. GCM10028923 TaxID=3273400 RepID=UPI00362259A5